jgi:DNA recombination protein RmuC
MQDTLIIIAGRPVTMAEALLILAVLVVVALFWLALVIGRSARERGYDAAAAIERSREIDDKMAELIRLQAEVKGGVASSMQGLSSRQSDIARFLTERIEGLQHRVGQGLADNVEKTSANLAQLNERLAVIDAAQKNLVDLTGEVVGLKDILANKQARGAYGQGRMEAIVRDGLPTGAYAFQATLSNGRRPDCLVTLPGDARPLVIDAKFPLEAFTALREAKGEDARTRANQRVRTDLNVHVKDIADKYVLSGETQDMALMFVPSESIYADLQEHFEDVVQKAHRARVMIVSPSLLALAIQVMQSLVRDARMRDEARKIQTEVGKLLDDVRRLRDRADKLETHFRQAGEDVIGIKTSADKIAKRGETIESLEFDDTPAPILPVVSAAPLLRAVE